MDGYSYYITKDIITKEPYISWSHDYSISNRVGSKCFDVDLNLNIKDGLPCLHFRYKGFKLNVKDRVYFLDIASNLILECRVIKRPHAFKDKVKEVDFVLSEDDIESLNKCCSVFDKIYIKYENGDSSIEIENRYDTIFDTYKDLLNTIRPNPKYESRSPKISKILFRDYVYLYIEALNKKGVSIGCSEIMQEDYTIKYDYCYVYLMRDTRNGYHKIGISNKPDVREKTLQSEVPAIEMVCSKKYPSRKIAKAIESALHNTYAEQRVRGEWFNLSPVDIQMLKETLS